MRSARGQFIGDFTFFWPLVVAGLVGVLGSGVHDSGLIRRAYAEGPSPEECEGCFLRMDVNMDGLINIVDPIFYLATFFFGPLQTLPCPDAADADDDGRHSIADAIFMLSYLFADPASRPTPRQPFPNCGVDPTPDIGDRFCFHCPPNLRPPEPQEFLPCIYPVENCPRER